jgi:hypothetical protein
VSGFGIGFGIDFEARTAVGAHTVAAERFSAGAHIDAAGRTGGRMFAAVEVRPRSNCQCLSRWFGAEAVRGASMGTAGQSQPTAVWGHGRLGNRDPLRRRPVGAGQCPDKQAGGSCCTFVPGMPL